MIYGYSNSSNFKNWNCIWPSCSIDNYFQFYLLIFFNSSAKPELYRYYMYHYHVYLCASFGVRIKTNFAPFVSICRHHYIQKYSQSRPWPPSVQLLVRETLYSVFCSFLLDKWGGQCPKITRICYLFVSILCVTCVFGAFDSVFVRRN